MFLKFEAQGGVVPMNVLRYDAFIEGRYNAKYRTRGASVYQKTSTLNAFPGMSAGLIYHIK